MTAVEASQPKQQKLAPAPRLSPRGLAVALITACLAPLTALSLYAIFYGSAAQHGLDVEVSLERRMIATADGGGAIPADVVVVQNVSGHEIPNLTIDLNGQYFLYRNSPLGEDQSVVVPQNIFATKSNQRFVPGRYPITEVTVTGRLPSGARGVTEVPFENDH